MTQQPSQWLSAYLYYQGKKEPLLLHLRPHLDKMLAAGSIRQFFFIRYYDQGPHIRLRLNRSEQISDATLQNQLQAVFQAFLADCSTNQRTYQTDGNQRPSNRIYFVPYEPEMLRYGGEKGMNISEEQFYLSSLIVTDLLQKGEPEYTKALGIALQMHLITLHGLGLPVDQLISCCEAGQAFWMPFGTNIDPYRPPQPIRIEDKIHEMKQSFSRQKAVIFTMLEEVWQALDSNKPFSLECFDRWAQSMRSITNRLKNVGEYQNVFTYKESPVLKRLLANCPNYWLIVDSYNHMTNNRLGVLNRDEGFLYYILTEYLKTKR